MHNAGTTHAALVMFFSASPVTVSMCFLYPSDYFVQNKLDLELYKATLVLH